MADLTRNGKFNQKMEYLTKYSRYDQKLLTNHYSGVSNSCRPKFISDKVCLLASIKVTSQTLPEINVGLQLLDTPESHRLELLE